MYWTSHKTPQILAGKGHVLSPCKYKGACLSNRVYVYYDFVSKQDLSHETVVHCIPIKCCLQLLQVSSVHGLWGTWHRQNIVNFMGI